ncbi:MAG: sulfate reduction electron transfer complex DsrMKJOP subunit DsrJ [Desulfotignum sp.]|nr:sulfate reduction electron transfer complex DsrMKJOP subunit DsrJ [Desulfotignum sp.]MCF8086594.1 sulfate reduction electron transfer complex DsrMKJOP subunit DsrJ [Desulfotignum sp.]MCF8136200.1 sulfate reduction electron transfer complex DsrMKJOP subunit DsrJ [Desulfotignum sp.]
MTKNMIMGGLAVFVLAVLSPFWFNMVTTTQAAPEPELLGPAKQAKKCVLDTYDMRTSHMSLLDEWRDAVVRDADRIYVAANGHAFNMSLSTGENSCLGCHEDKAKFCDACHTYTSVDPYCWDCHTNPKEIE